MRTHHIKNGRHWIRCVGQDINMDICIGSIRLNYAPGAKEAIYIPPTKYEIEQWLGRKEPIVMRTALEIADDIENIRARRDHIRATNIANMGLNDRIDLTAQEMEATKKLNSLQREREAFEKA